MKKFLLFLSCLSTIGVNAQADVVVLNGLYTDPSSSAHEFMELYNSSLRNINMDDYTVLLYF